MELLDIVDEENNLTGKTEEKEIVHKIPYDTGYIFVFVRRSCSSCPRLKKK